MLSQEKKILSPKCLLVLDKLNELRFVVFRKPFLGELGMGKKVRGNSGQAS